VVDILELALPTYLKKILLEESLVRVGRCNLRVSSHHLLFKTTLNKVLFTYLFTYWVSSMGRLSGRVKWQYEGFLKPSPQ
jgi:hypothetical protein